MSVAFREVVFCDFEFSAPAGERPRPICCVAHELHSGRKFRLFGEFGAEPPWAAGDDVLFVAHFATAELGCFLALNWPLPKRVFCTYTEFRNLTNGRRTVAGNGLLGALAHYGLDHGAAVEKEDLQVALGTGTWQGRYSPDEILNYCEADVVAVGKLFTVLVRQADTLRAVLRGRFLCAIARMEFAGVPLDLPILQLLRSRWDSIQSALIESVDADYHVFEDRTFKREKFTAWLADKGIRWPRLDSGNLALDDDTFREMSRAHPEVSPLRELRSSLSELRLESLAVGADGRNRCLLSPFATKTGRNAPSNSKFIFGPSTWLRSLIKPPPGYAIIYADYKSQEIGVAAALSGDEAMLAAYGGGDPYLSYAKTAGLVPNDATKQTHPAERELAKTVCLAINYGQTEFGLAQRLNQSLVFARMLLAAHRTAYKKFWTWSDAAVDTAVLMRQLSTVYGWRYFVDDNPNPRALRNWPMQANAAEMLRLAAILSTEQGLEIVCPIHDALMMLSPLDRLDHEIEILRRAMTEASRLVLDGFEVGVDVSTTAYPGRYEDPRGRIMWSRVMQLLDAQNNVRGAA